ncbi:MAG: ribbon-helix-helix domain-containing protein [Nanoarchaeota archaeon]|nr:ribbon-helix-helix domain-containing protein [Nanoarchaeota archaeon]
MAMEQIQVRISKGIIERVDSLVEAGIYETRSDAIRDGVRKLVVSDLVGIIPNKGDTIKDLKALRKKLSKGMTKEKLLALNKLMD